MGEFDWINLYDQQFTSFGGNKAVVVEISDRPEPRRYAAEEIFRRGLEKSIQFTSFYSDHSIDAAKEFKDGECSFVFIDCPHDYETTLSNIRAWYRTVHYNSVLAGHGSQIPEVMRAAQDFCTEKDIPLRTHGSYWFISHCHKPKELW